MPDLAFSAAGIVVDNWTVQNLQCIASTNTFTATSASPCVFTLPNLGLTNGTIVTLSGTVPTGFTANTSYFVINASGLTFQLSATLGGAAINSTSTGNGTVSIINTDMQFV